jgi:thiol-disulfide isomerase/thioredoxin
MKKILYLTCCLFSIQYAFSQGYKVTLQTSSYDSGMAYLTYHMGKNLNIADSGIVNSKGVVVFKGEKSLPGGIYALVFPGKRQSLDFFIDKEQSDIRIKADTNDLMNAKVTGSPENDLFQQYQKFIAEKGALLQQEKTAYSLSVNKKDSALHEARYTKLNQELNDYRNGIIEKQPESMMAVCLQAMKDPEIPIKDPKNRADSLYNYYKYKSKFWEGVTFMDDRIIRTPFFQSKIERYYRDLIPQDPDSIIADLDYKLLLARSSDEMYKFLLNWSTDEYINPKIMGLDKVFVHLFNKYHSKGLTPWLNEKQMETISRRAYMQMANLIGEQAANLNMLDLDGKPVNLYDTKGQFTVVIFWDPTCGHCKQEIPRIDSIYRASWKARNVRIFAVLTEDKLAEWKQYIREHDLTDWAHVYETKEMADAIVAAQKPGFRQLYDVISTPTIFLLDAEKRIIGKKLTWSQVDDLMQVKMGLKK